MIEQINTAQQLPRKQGAALLHQLFPHRSIRHYSNNFPRYRDMPAAAVQTYLSNDRDATYVPLTYADPTGEAAVREVMRAA